MLSKILLTLMLSNLAIALSINNSDLYKEKQELIEIKDELNEFYEIKELEYLKQKKELEKLHKSIQEEEKVILKTK